MDFYVTLTKSCANSKLDFRPVLIILWTKAFLLFDCPLKIHSIHKLKHHSLC